MGKNDADTDHQSRVAPTLGDLIAAMLLDQACANCGHPIQHRGNLAYNHSPPLADRTGPEWQGIHPNDPRYIDLQHRRCHDKQTAVENSRRAKADRTRRKNEPHNAAMAEKIGQFKLPAVTQPKSKPKTKWPKRSFPKRGKPKP